jgi:hypothetical protein
MSHGSIAGRRRTCFDRPTAITQDLRRPRGHNTRDRAAPPLKTERRPSHNLGPQPRDCRGLGLSCWLMHIETPAEGNGQGRTAATADALQTSFGARLYLSKGSAALHDVEGFRRAKCHPIFIFFRPWSSSGFPSAESRAQNDNQQKA